MYNFTTSKIFLEWIDSVIKEFIEKNGNDYDNFIDIENEIKNISVNINNIKNSVNAFISFMRIAIYSEYIKKHLNKVLLDFNSFDDVTPIVNKLYQNIMIERFNNNKEGYENFWNEYFGNNKKVLLKNKKQKRFKNVKNRVDDLPKEEFINFIKKEENMNK